MARRIPIQTLIAPNGMYQRQAMLAAGYRPAPDSRFAVVRAGPAAPWALTHVKSGGSLDSILPARGYKITMTEKLAVAAAFEAASYVDWSAFDALPQVTESTTDCPTMSPPPSRATMDNLRQLVAQALA